MIKVSSQSNRIPTLMRRDPSLRRHASQLRFLLLDIVTIAMLFVATLIPLTAWSAGDNLLWARRAKILGDPAAAKAVADAIKAGAAASAASFSVNLDKVPSNSSAAPASVSPPAAGQWVTALNMSTQREGHTATRLVDGRILVAGGFDNNIDTLNSVDIYNPSTNTWSPGPPMSVARSFHTATLLADGRVLVAGGSDQDDNSLTSVEIFNPVTNSWSNAAPLGTIRDTHSATLLNDGRVLVAGGQSVSGIPGSPVLVTLKTAEIYTPGTDSWAPTASMAAFREAHTATLLPNGFVLVAGGDNYLQGPPFTETTLASAELFNPAGPGTWSPTSNNMNDPRLAHTATLLPSGKVLVVAGDNFTRTPSPDTITFRPLLTVDLYDPATNTWSAAAPLATVREDHTATLLADGRVLVAGGEYNNLAPPITDIALNTSITYTPATNSWLDDATLITPRDAPTATLLADNTRVLATGGENFDCPDGGDCLVDDILASAELFNAPIALIYNTPLRDLVRQANQNQTPDGNLDPTFTVIFPAGGTTKLSPNCV